MEVKNNREISLECPINYLIHTSKESRINIIGNIAIIIPLIGGMCLPVYRQSDKVKACLLNQIKIFLLNKRSPLAFIRRFKHVSHVDTALKNDGGNRSCCRFRCRSGWHKGLCGLRQGCRCFRGYLNIELATSRQKHQKNNGR